MEGSDPGHTEQRSRIEMRGLRVVAICGVLPEERERAQPLEIDLDLEIDIERAASTDDLSDTVDYGRVADQVTGLVAHSSFQLLEALAGAIARQALASDERVLAVAVTVRKLRPPVALDVATVGVRAVQRRKL